MALGNKGFAGLVIGGGEGAPETRRPPRTGFLGARENRLAELSSGAMMTRVHEAVDPDTCRIWQGHNRDYEALNEQACSDLIDSLRAQGRQEVPAIVRRVTGDPKIRFEVICGARRHWSVSWLRRHHFPDFKFIVEPRELTDEEAFCLADLENRSRKDLSDYERATDYARAVERYYDGSQQRMAERLQVTKSWLSRYLELAKLPPEVLACFGSPHVIGITHAASLAPRLSHPRDRAQLMEAAAELAAEQMARKERGGTPLAPAQVVSRLLAAKPDPLAKAPPAEKIVDEEGRVILTARWDSRSGLLVAIPKTRLKDAAIVGMALDRYLSGLGATDDKRTEDVRTPKPRPGKRVQKAGGPR
ncbi:ParB/RepB/Spo0J family partition protein [Acidisoma sp.]|uniref:ParB/RepB/Spo0J family partition protein n=1 Tax=Acidisoma sp. TaxID=1872115 RepID=UPI003B009ECC